MELILFIGIQATGKSTFYRERFFLTHVRVNLDMLRTRHRETLLLNACLEGKTPFVVDNTNVAATERRRYILPAKEFGFHVNGYFFQSSVRDALERNAQRAARSKVPDIAIKGTSARLETPDPSEGFDELFYVRIDADKQFIVEKWKHEI